MESTENKRNNTAELVNITSVSNQIKLFKKHIKQYKQACIEYLERPESTQDEADTFIELSKLHIALLTKAIEIAKENLSKNNK